MKISLTAEKKPLLSKALLIMKMTTILLTCVVLQVSAKGFGQEKLNLQFKKTEIASILTTIEKATNYRFLYDNSIKGIRLKVNIDVKNADVKQVLDEMFANTGLSYQFMENNLIVIKEGTEEAPEAKAVITGKVTGDGGVPLSGVSVQVKGSNRGTTTNDQGVYSINVADADVLVFSYIGYDSQEMPVAGKTEINVALVLAKGELNQVVVIGYGTQKKRDLTGSIAVISGDDVAKLPANNPVSSLQGRVAGLTIVNSGQAGAAPTVRIRGVNSTNNADPLYVVDGILQTNIDYLNAADIETLEVLKDPSSIAIYGLQGGNGVIIITTKRAKRGQTNISFQSNVGVQQVNNKIKVVDAAGFKKLYSAQLANINAAPFDFSNYNGNTDWQDQIYRSAVTSNNSLSISNSTDKSTTYLNVGYSNQQGVEKYDHYQKYIARLNEEIRIDKNIRVGADFTGFYWKQNPPVGGIENEALWAAPIVPVKAGPGLYYAMPTFQRAQVINPLAAVDYANGNNLNSGYRVTGSIFAEIKFLRNFTWKSTVYTDLGFSNGRSYNPLPFHYLNIHEDGTPGADTSYAVNPHTSVSQAQSTYKTFQQDHTLTFDKTLAGGHHLTVLAGFSTLYHYSEYINGNRTDTSLNIPNDPRFWYLSIAQASNPGGFDGGAGEDASTSFLGRVNYSYKGRYLLNVSFRRDGTSKFSPSHQWGNFGSVGAGWVVTDEKFLQDVQWLDFLKLKASWGTVGNGLNIGNYLSYPGLNSSGVGIFGNNVYTSVAAAYVPDPNLHWEVVEGKDAGFEARLLKNRLNVDVDFYDRKTHDILTALTLPGASGNTTYFTNLGTIDNKGIEVTLGWHDKIGKDFTYSINGNFSVNKNNVESIGDNINFQITNGVNLTQSGYSIGYFYGYKQLGIYQNTAQIDKSPHLASAAPGDIMFEDVNKDGKIDQNDRTNLGTPFPKYNFGGSITMAYKGFDLLVETQGVAGNKIYVARRTATFATLNYEVNRLNAWTGAGSTNIEPILDNTRSNNFLFSNYWLEPGDYFRLRNIQLGYTFNTGRNPNSPIKMLRLYVNAQNVATFTHATGYSPEVPISSPTTAGADNGVYPVPAIYSFGVNLTF